MPGLLFAANCSFGATWSELLQNWAAYKSRCTTVLVLFLSACLLRAPPAVRLNAHSYDSRAHVWCGRGIGGYRMGRDATRVERQELHMGVLGRTYVTRRSTSASV